MRQARPRSLCRRKAEFPNHEHGFPEDLARHFALTRTPIDGGIRNTWPHFGIFASVTAHAV
jgi:hypothetical protein